MWRTSICWSIDHVPNLLDAYTSIHLLCIKQIKSKFINFHYNHLDVTHFSCHSIAFQSHTHYTATFIGTVMRSFFLLRTIARRAIIHDYLLATRTSHTFIGRNRICFISVMPLSIIFSCSESPWLILKSFHYHGRKLYEINSFQIVTKNYSKIFYISIILCIVPQQQLFICNQLNRKN